MDLIERCIGKLKQTIDVWKRARMQRNCQHDWQTLRQPDSHDMSPTEEYCPKCKRTRQWLEGYGELRSDDRPARW